ncbi:MAG: PAS domain S-box protein [Desulfobacterales bacterium]|nr:PAS domain S-box protein [Desulfobacterales bacterium]
MKATLGKKIVLIVTGILLLTTLAGVWVSGAIFSHVYSKALQSKSTLIGGFLASQLNRLLALGIPLDELVGFESQCREIVENQEEISYAMVVDPDGVVLFHSDPSLHETIVSPERLKNVENSPRSFPLLSSIRVRDSEAVVPIFDPENRRIGNILVGFPGGIVSEATRRLALYSAAASFLFYGIAVGLLVLALSEWIGKPLRLLRDAISEVTSRGRPFSGTVKVASDDEIGEIAAAFNKMKESLQKTTVSRDYARAIIESVTDALIVTDQDCTIVQTNKAARDLLNYRDEEILGREMGTLFSSDEKEIVTSVMPDPAGNRQVRNLQLSFCTKEGRKIPVLLSTAGIRDADGRMFGIATGKDITELKRLEKEREKLIQDLQSALAKVKILSGMLPICASCHKIRTDSGYWESLEKYIEQNSDAVFTHGICPDCEQRLYPFKKEEK